MRTASVFKIIGLVLLGIIGIAAVGLGLGLVVMWLWNWLVPAIFGLPALSYWQAVGLTVLCHLLFKSHMHPRHRDHKHPKKVNDFRSKLRSMLHRDEALPEGSGETG